MLLDKLQITARAAARRFWNDPDAVRHIDGCVLMWLLRWDPDRDWSVRTYIARVAANEIRRVRAIRSDAEREKHYSRTRADWPRVVRSDPEQERVILS